MKILVTGGAGYIGSHAVKLLLEKRHQVVVVDNLFRGFYQPLEVLKKKFPLSKLIFHQADLRDFEAIKKILQKEKPDAVMHFAALCLVAESMEKPALYFENNVLGSLNLFKAMLAAKVNHLVFSSTCAVYGETKKLPLDESQPTKPINPYGESKLMVEKMLYWFDEIQGLKSVVFRYFNVCGAASDGLIGDSKKPSQLLVQNAVRGALGMESFKLTCPKVNTPDGTPIRDYINVEDLAEAHLKAVNYLRAGGQSEIFNLGTGQGDSVLEIVKQVQKITGVKFPIKKGEARQGEWAQVYADIRKAKKILGWQPRRTIKDSVASLIKWYQNHPHGWKN